MKLIRIGWLILVAFLFALTLPGQELGREEPAPKPYTRPGQMDRPASVPRLIRFVGALKDATGKARTGQVAVQFAIYREERDESALWTEIQNVLADEKGQYTVLLGTASPEGIPFELFATAEQRWLGVRVADPGESEQPRALLVSVPYALKAGDAETLGGKPASEFLLRSETHEPPSPTSAHRATYTADGLPRQSIVVGPPTANVGGDNYLVKWLGGTPSAQSLIYDNGSAVGIATTSPQTRLDVSGVAYGKTASFGVGGFDTRFDLGDGLTVSSIFTANNAYSLLGRNVYYDGAFKHSLDTSAGYPTGAYIQLVRSGDISFGVTTDGNTAKDSAATLHDNVTFLAGGNVGIGTTSPSQKLEVAGNLKVSGSGNGIVFPDGTLQTTACGSLAFGTPGQVSLASSRAPAATQAELQALRATVAEQQQAIDALRRELQELRAGRAPRQ